MQEEPREDIYFSDVPEYLHPSYLYKHLEESETDILPKDVLFHLLPENYSFEDLVKNMQMLNYWCVENTPWYIYECWITCGYYIDELLDIFTETAFHEELTYFHSTNVNSRLIYVDLQLFKNENLFNVFKFANNKNPFDKNMIIDGLLLYSPMIYIRHAIEELDAPIFERTIPNAAFKGRLDVMKYLFGRGHKFDNFRNSPLSSALSEDYDDCFMFAYEHGCDFNELPETFHKVIEQKPLEFIKQVINVENKHKFSNYISGFFTKGALQCAIDYHREDLFYYLDSLNIFERNHEVPIAAADEGLYDLLRYILKETNYPTDTEFICYRAAQSGRLDCLKLAHEHGCPWQYDNLLSSAAFFGRLDCIIYIHEHENEHVRLDICSILVKKGYIDCLKYVHENIQRADSQTMRLAREHNQKECIEYLQSQNIE